MKTQITPGEWKVINWNGTLQSTVMTGNANSSKDVVCETYYDTAIPAEAAEANAKLIAASPKMFEHLLSFIHYIEQEKLTVSGGLLAEMDSAKRTVKQITNDQ